MAEAVGFQFREIGLGEGQLAPVVLLHGSGSCEDALVPFGRRVAPDRSIIAVRGRVPWQDGYAFFRRHSDRTLDYEDLAERSREFCAFLDHLCTVGRRAPLLLGVSNGAIMAAAAIARASDLSSGAVLLRPLSPFIGAVLPPLRCYPLLLVGGSADTRRLPSDTPQLAEQFRQAGASVTEHVLPIGHSLDEAGLDYSLVRNWLASRD
jgi:phospholipase/carboxylesterase